MRLALVGACALSCGLQCAVSVVSPGIIIIVHLDASNAVLYRHLFVSFARFPHIRALNTFAKYRLATWRKNFGKCRIGTIYKEYLLGAGIKACTSLPQSDTTVQGIAPCISSRANTAMFIAVAAYQIAYRGMGAAAANDCSQNKTQQIVFVLHYIYYICRVIYKLWQTYKKNTEREYSSPANLPICFCACLSLPGVWCPSCFDGGTSDSVIPPYLHCPSQYHVCVLPQWCTSHGISVLLYVESTFCSAIINYHLSHPVFLSSIIPKNTCARAIFQSEQQKIRPLATENPPSRNRKPRFASPQKQSTAPSLGVSPYVSWGHADASPWPSAA